MVDFSVARTKMVDGQIRPNDVTSHAVISAFLKVPREKFVNEADAPLAYLDRDVPLASGRVLTSPMVLAKLIQSLDLKAGEKVLEIGAATGYGAAVLAEVGVHVVSVEEDGALASTAAVNLAGLGVELSVGPLVAGSASGAPFDAILINGAIEELPAAIAGQLIEGGRLAVVVGTGKAARLTLYTKVNGQLSPRILANMPAVVLPGFARKPEFTF